MKEKAGAYLVGVIVGMSRLTAHGGTGLDLFSWAVGKVAWVVLGVVVGRHLVGLLEGVLVCEAEEKRKMEDGKVCDDDSQRIWERFLMLSDTNRLCVHASTLLWTARCGTEPEGTTRLHVIVAA